MPRGFGTVYDFKLWVLVIEGDNYPGAEVIIYGTKREAEKHAGQIRDSDDGKDGLVTVRLEEHHASDKAPEVKR